MKRLIILILMLVGLQAMGATNIVPRQNYTSEVSNVIMNEPLILTEGGSWIIGWRFLQDSVAKDLSTVTNTTFYYTPSDRSWTVAVTGEVENATNGMVLVHFLPANLSTNTNNDTFSWRLEARDSVDVLAYAEGQLLVNENIAASPNPLVSTTNINWADILLYLNPASGPYFVDGTAITSTTNASGQVTFTATGSGMGDMLKATYDPTSIAGDVFAMSNMVESATELILTDTERSKLYAIDAGADTNNISDVDATDLTDTGDSTLHYHATDRDRANHTGTQDRDTITGFDVAVSTNADVTANTAKLTYPVADSNKLYAIDAGADTNNISDVDATDLTDTGDSTLHYHAADRARANHTGTQLATTISDFDTAVSTNSDFIKADGTIAPSATMNWGGQGTTNTAYTEYISGGATGKVDFALIDGTNFLRARLFGGSTTNLYPLVF